MNSMIRRAGLTGAVCSLLSLAGCGGDAMNSGSMSMPAPMGSMSSSTSSTMLEANFDSIQADVFTPICAGCHSGPNAASNLALDAMHSYDDLVNVPSTEQPTLDRVKPFDPANSYLIIHMQKEGDGAPSSDIPFISQWIMSGAMPGMSMMTMSAAFQVASVQPDTGTTLLAAPPRIIVGFTQELDASSVNASSVRLERIDDMKTVATRLSIPAGNAHALMLTPASELPPGRYQVILEATAGRDLRSLLGSSLNSPTAEVTGERIVTRFSVAPPAN
jgi:hypothetical protein